MASTSQLPGGFLNIPPTPTASYSELHQNTQSNQNHSYSQNHHNSHSASHSHRHSHPHHSHHDTQRHTSYIKSSIFVPQEWEVNNKNNGVVALITNVFKELSNIFTQPQGFPGQPSKMPAILRDNGQPKIPKFPKFPQQPPLNPSRSFHPGTQSVIISNDNHGMFSHSMSRMNFHRGHARISSESVSTTCPRCKKNINTLVKQRPGALHILATAGAMALGLACNAQALLPLAMLPMQLKSLHPAVHYCPICNYKMGKNVRLTVPMV